MVENYPVWFEGKKKREPYSKFKGREKTEIAIIGGGLTGASSAYFLSKAGYKVTLLDAHLVGRSKTATSAGMMAFGTEDDLSDTIYNYGIDAAKRLWNSSLYGIKLLESAITQDKIECSIENTGSLYLAAKRRHVKSLEEEFNARKQLNYSAQLLDSKQVEERIGSNYYHSALYSPYDKQINPVELTEELIDIAKKKSANIHEHSAVKSVYPVENKVFLKTELGELEADKVIVATDAYTYTLGLGHDVLPIAYQSVATEPLQYDVFNSIFKKGKTMLWDSFEFYDYFRPTQDGRLIIGGGDVFVGHHREHFDIHTQKAPEQLNKILQNAKKVFPQLANVKITNHWSGICGHSKSGLPIIGSDNKYPHVIYSVAFGGHGLASSFASGKLIEHYLKTKDEEVFSAFHPPLEIKNANEKRISLIPQKLKHKILHNYYNAQKKVERLV